MLTEIKCDLFRSKAVFFQKGLNVVLGDEKAANSIGKSSLLMVIDFVYGGNTFITHNTDVVSHLGHHKYFFCLEVDGVKNYFGRGTKNHKMVSVCSREYKVEKEIPLAEYNDFLRKMYLKDLKGLTFRSVAGLFGRVWGKDNLNVKKPLHTATATTGEDAISLLLKLFNRSEIAKEQMNELSLKDRERSAFRAAFANGIAPQITRAKFDQNEELVENYSKEMEDIRSDLAKYAMNISEITNKDVLELKVKKDELLKLKLSLESSLKRVDVNLSENKNHLKQRFVGLQTFFPEIHLEKLEEIEFFHEKIKKILDTEFKSSKTKLQENLKIINEQLLKIDNELKGVLSKIKDPTAIVDRVSKINFALKQAQTENEYHTRKKRSDDRAKELEKEIAGIKKAELIKVENLINDKTKEVVKEIYNEERKAPVLTLEEKGYEFKIAADTGTGKAYSNLIVFDLSMFELSPIPFIIHDSVLYKNIENTAISKIIEKYLGYERQTFIAIDEIDKYGEKTALILRKNKVIQLSSSELLYSKDWRNR